MVVRSVAWNLPWSPNHGQYSVVSVAAWYTNIPTVNAERLRGHKALCAAKQHSIASIAIPLMVEMVRTENPTFDEVAGIYDEVRPRYPKELTEDIVSLSKIPDGGRILEIGCGTGQATLSFAERGYSMLCLEPGKNLAEIASRNCQQYPNVTIKTVSFEDWDPGSELFDLLISAQAFHWIPKETGYPKAAKVLRDTGSIALFWNMYPDPDTEFFRELQDVYREHAPQLAEAFAQRDPFEVRIANREDEINATRLFERVVMRRYPCSVQYTGDQYVKLLETFSDHRKLEDTAKHGLYQAVRNLIERFGGTVTRPHVAVLFFAKKIS